MPKSNKQQLISRNWVCLITMGSGLFNLLLAVNPNIIITNKAISIFLGLALILSSVYIYQQKERAYKSDNTKLKLASIKADNNEFKTMDPEKAVLVKIFEEHGKSSLDFFKLWKDKSYFFSHSTHSVIAYRIEDDSIIVLGDPVGPDEEIEELVRDFTFFCKEHGWNLSFFQTTDRYLDIYERLGFRKLKIGDDAVVDLENFNLEGAKKKDFRNRIRKLEKLGYSINSYNAPISAMILKRLKEISNDWLEEPGRKERGFSLGSYDNDYIESYPILTVENNEGFIVAFLNVIPSYKTGEVGMDLMRKSKEAPSGAMDYLFVQFILKMQEQGYKSINIGMAPMSGFSEHEKASMEEKAIHGLFQRLNFLFNYIGLKVFKAKFADSWEPRYLIYKDPHELPNLAITINKVLNKV